MDNSNLNILSQNGTAVDTVPPEQVVTQQNAAHANLNTAPQNSNNGVPDSTRIDPASQPLPFSASDEDMAEIHANEDPFIHPHGTIPSSTRNWGTYIRPPMGRGRGVHANPHGNNTVANHSGHAGQSFLLHVPIQPAPSANQHGNIGQQLGVPPPPPPFGTTIPNMTVPNNVNQGERIAPIITSPQTAESVQNVSYVGPIIRQELIGSRSNGQMANQPNLNQLQQSPRMVQIPQQAQQPGVSPVIQPNTTANTVPNIRPNLPIYAIEWPELQANFIPPLPLQPKDQIPLEGHVIRNITYKPYIPQRSPTPAREVGLVPSSLHAHPEKGYKALPELEPRATGQPRDEYLVEKLSNTRHEFNRELNKVSTRVGNLEDNSQKHDMWYENVMKQLSNITESAKNDRLNLQAQSENINNLRLEVNVLQESILAQGANTTSWHETIRNVLIQESVYTHDKIDRIHAQHKNTTDRLINVVGTLTNKVVEIETSTQDMQQALAQIPTTGFPSSSAGPIQCVFKQSMPTSADALRKNGIVFDESLRYHPHYFLNLFNNYLRNIKLDEEHRCSIFRMLVEVKDSDQWKRENIGTILFAQMEINFLDVFWSRRVQNTALQKFRELQFSAKSIKSIIFELTKWMDSLMKAKYPEEDQIIAIAHKKLPSSLVSRVADTDLATLETFKARLSRLADSPDPGAVKRFTLQEEEETPREQRFSYKDYKANEGQLKERFKQLKAPNTPANVPKGRTGIPAGSLEAGSDANIDEDDSEEIPQQILQPNPPPTEETTQQSEN